MSSVPSRLVSPKAGKHQARKLMNRKKNLSSRKKLLDLFFPIKVVEIFRAHDAIFGRTHDVFVAVRIVS